MKARENQGKDCVMKKCLNVIGVSLLIVILASCGGNKQSQESSSESKDAVSENVEKVNASEPVVSEEKEEAEPEPVVTKEEEPAKDTDEGVDTGAEQAGDASGDTDENEDVTVGAKTGDMALNLVESEDGIMVNELILARKMHKRSEKPEHQTQFSAEEGNKIVAIMDVKNPLEEPQAISVSWLMPDGKTEIGKTELEVTPSKGWWTSSRTRYAKKTGMWKAIVRNAEDQIIAEAPFEMVE